jgi:hypothetical protein
MRKADEDAEADLDDHRRDAQPSEEIGQHGGEHRRRRDQRQGLDGRLVHGATT